MRSVLPKPPEPILGSIDGDSYRSLAEYKVNFSDWLSPLEFTIASGTKTDIASIPWYLRWIHDRASLGLAAPFLHDWMLDRQGKYTNTNGEDIHLSWFDVHLFFLVAMRLDGIPPFKSLIAFLIVLICNRPIWSGKKDD
jgi:hypothetical protein